jgi:hypothetical protein
MTKKIEQRGETTMKRNLPVFAALAMSLISSAFVPSLKAGEWDKKTTLTISQPVAVQGTILPAGQYVLRVQDSSSLNVVYILNSEETQLIITVLASHADRLQPTDKSEFSFYESPSGQPAALHLWFYPGDNYGFEFLRPQPRVAAESSAAGN